MPRFDVHRPAVIEPADYEFIKFDYLPDEGDVLGTALFLAEGRARFVAHMKATGARFSTHEHGGSCHVCGAHAVYTATFFHAKTNRYICTGLDCAEKLDCGGTEDFRKKVHAALEAVAGKRKAKAVLEKAELAEAWTLVEAMDERREDYRAAYAAWGAANPTLAAEPHEITDEAGAPKWKDFTTEEYTVEDIVRKLVKYGDITDKAMNYVKVLLERIKKAPEIAAARAAEAAAAKPVPVTKGRVKVRGKVLTVRHEEHGRFGPTTKMLVAHADGWKLWGTKPGNLDAVRGDEVEFEAKVTVSDKDPKFGFWARPTKARLIEKEAAA